MVSTKTIDDLIRRHGILTDQITKEELRVILRYASQVIEQDIAGDFVELGCYEGTTSVYLARLLAGTEKLLYVYDSFSGLPEKHQKDMSGVGEQFQGGELRASRSKLVAHFRHAGLRLPIIKRAWFQDLQPHDLPDQISFAFLDGDFYESIMDSLRLIWPRLSHGAVVVVDDYHTESLPGVRKALDEWAPGHRFRLMTEASLAILTDMA